ncbi:unnamed protein product [Zymoseptoria tritici ST99CH_3D1]|nr:unnamed protein product [Zymoseptoria tritici ST99CH_3D1]
MAEDRDDVWTDYENDGASDHSDYYSDRSHASTAEQRDLHSYWAAEEEEKDAQERRRLQRIWQRQRLQDVRRRLQEKLEDLDNRPPDVWWEVVRHCVAERLQSVESELGVEVVPLPSEKSENSWPTMRLITALLILTLFCCQLYAIHTARQSVESSSLGSRYIATLPAVQTFPPLDLTICHLRTPEMERIRGFRPIWQMLERATTQSAGDVTDFNTALASSTARWNETLYEAAQADERARSREWLLLGGLVRDLEWAGLSFPQSVWAGGEAMAAVDAATMEYREKWVERMRLIEGQWRILSSGLSSEARVVRHLRHEALRFASMSAREEQGREAAVRKLGDVLDLVGSRLQRAVELADEGRRQWLIAAENQRERNDEVMDRVAARRKCSGGAVGWWWRWERSGGVVNSKLRPHPKTNVASHIAVTQTTNNTPVPALSTGLRQNVLRRRHDVFPTVSFSSDLSLSLYLIFLSIRLHSIHGIFTMDDRHPNSNSRPATPDQTHRSKTARTPKTGNDMQRVTHGLWAKLEKVKSLEAKYPESKGTRSAPHSPVERKRERNISVGRDLERSMSVGGHGKSRPEKSRKEKDEDEVKVEGRAKKAHHGSRKEEKCDEVQQVLPQSSTPWWSWRKSPPPVHQPQHPSQQFNPQHSPPQYNPQHPPQYNPQDPCWHYNPQLPPQPPYNPPHRPPSNVHREDPETECEEFRKHCCESCLPLVSWFFWTSVAVLLAFVRWGWWIWMSIWPPLAKTIWKKVGLAIWKTEWTKSLEAVRKKEWKKDAVNQSVIPPEEAIPPVVEEEKAKKCSPKSPHPGSETLHVLPNTPQDQKPQRPSVWPCSFSIAVLVAIVGIIIALLVLLCRVFNPNLTQSPDQPVDALIKATNTIAAALEPLIDTAQWQVYSKLAACEFVEAAANVSHNPFQYDVFRQARKKGGSGWGCPSPNMPDVRSPDEGLARLGLKLAVEMRNIQALLRRSSSESLAAGRAAAHIATRVKFAASDSNACRIPYTLSEKVSPPLFTCLSPSDPTIAALNGNIADLNHTLTSFAASHISLLTALEDSATICQTRLADWNEAKSGPRKIRGVRLADRAEAICSQFAKKFEQRILFPQLSEENQRMNDIVEARARNEEEDEEDDNQDNLAPFLEARRRMEDAMGVLRGVTTSDWKRRDGVPFDWVHQPARASATTVTGETTTAAGSKKQQRRCRVLGAPLSSSSPGPEEDDEDGQDDVEEHAAWASTLHQTLLNMEKSAQLAGTLTGVEDVVRKQ